VPERFKDNILQRMDADAAAQLPAGSELQNGQSVSEIAETYGREAAVSLKR
jgi:hypothetical protein